MRKLILATVAAIAITGGLASAQGIILGSDENSRKIWINTWAGQTEDKVYGRHYGQRETYRGSRGRGSASTFSGDRKFRGIILGSDENDRKVWINQFPR